MAALTSDVIVDRVRSICASAPFHLTEAPAWDTFDLAPTTAIDGMFRVVTFSQGVRDWMNYREERTDGLQVWVARKHANNFNAARQTLLRDVHSLTTAITRDGAETSGEYVVLDEGRGHALVGDPSREYVQLRLTLPVNYEAQV